jgi:hypothetical protein
LLGLPNSVYVQFNSLTEVQMRGTPCVCFIALTTQLLLLFQCLDLCFFHWSMMIIVVNLFLQGNKCRCMTASLAEAQQQSKIGKLVCSFAYGKLARGTVKILTQIALDNQ